MKRVALYARVSTTGQDPEMQLLDLRKHAEEMALAEPHAAHAASTVKLQKGKDPAAKPVPRPAATPQQEARTSPGTYTMRKLCDAYLAQHAVKKKSGAEDARYTARDILPVFGTRSAGAIGRIEILKFLAAKATTAPIAANRLRALIHGIYEWAIDNELVKVNPCCGIKMPAKENPRDRILLKSEIRQFWQRLATAPIEPETRQALQLLLITGQRSDIVRTAEWSEFSMPDRIWTIPASKMKNKILHRVHLSPMALDVIAAANPSGRYLFPGATRVKRANKSEAKGDRPFPETVLSTAVRRNLEHFGCGQWTPHDLRRTVASQMAESGIAPDTIERVLAHVDKSAVKNTYNRYSYDREKRAALDLWSDVLAGIIADSK